MNPIIRPGASPLRLSSGTPCGNTVSLGRSRPVCPLAANNSIEIPPRTAYLESALCLQGALCCGQKCNSDSLEQQHEGFPAEDGCSHLSECGPGRSWH